MATTAVSQNRWRKRLGRLAIISTLMGISFAAGAAIMAVLAVRLLSPIVVMGLLGIAAAGANATTNALYFGDSATRLAALTQLKQSFEAEPTPTIDAQTAAWILPAIEQCKTDGDAEVVAMAEQLATDIRAKATDLPE
jgi:hypothetical protein